MVNKFLQLIFSKLKQKNISTFTDIRNFQKTIKDEFVKERVTSYFYWFKDNYNQLEYF